jgi:tetratricopeptide (TPR) repeat protein
LLFGKPVASAGRAEPELTRRERDVLAALCRPLAGADVFAEPASVRQMAETLVVTEAAVKQHLLHLYDKFGIAESGERRRVRLAKEAIRRGAVDLGQVDRAGRFDAGADELLRAGREAVVQRDWDSAFRLLSDAHARRPLGPEDLQRLGEAGYWTDRHEDSFESQRSAYHAYAKAGDNAQAAYMALMLTIHHANRLDLAVAGGWFAKAQRLLADAPECFAHGHEAVVTALFSEADGDWPAMREQARRAHEIGIRCDDADLQALGLAFEGLARTHLGEVAEGTRLLDEAMASAVAGELAMMPTGIIYCRMLCACLDLQDFRRAHEWTKVIDRCAARPGLGGLPGDCRTHRAEVLLRQGAFAEGAQEALRGVEETATLDLAHAGIACRELGEIRLRQGELEGAEESLLRAHEYGMSPEPGLALLRLARGELRAAAAGLDTTLDALGASRLARARVLPAKVEVALAGGDLEAARRAVGELEETAELYRTPALAAAAEHARGAYELSADDTAEAQRRLASALRLWQRVHAPYDAARARVLLAEAHLARGDRDSGLLELRTAQTAFERLGARPDAERTEGRLLALRR